MQDVIYLVILNLIFIFILVHLMERRVRKSYSEKYGAEVEKFETVLVSMRNFDLKNIPRNNSVENNDSVYSKLLVLSNSYVNSYMILEKNKNQLEEFSFKNKELIHTYIQTLRSLKKSAKNFSKIGMGDNGSDNSDIDNLVLKIEETILKLSKDNNYAVRDYD